jgi:hypothetical protein
MFKYTFRPCTYTLSLYQSAMSGHNGEQLVDFMLENQSQMKNYWRLL